LSQLIDGFFVELIYQIRCGLPERGVDLLGVAGDPDIAPPAQVQRYRVAMEISMKSFCSPVAELPPACSRPAMAVVMGPSGTAGGSICRNKAACGSDEQKARAINISSTAI